MEANQERKLSPIVAIHRRYEETLAEYRVIEEAESAALKGNDKDTASALARAMQASCRETDALRTAILHQVPSSWPEAAVLQFHILNALDLLIGCTRSKDSEQEALQTAVDTLFDFMCSAPDAEHEGIGSSFQDAAERAQLVRRRRTGVLEG